MTFDNYHSLKMILFYKNQETQTIDYSKILMKLSLDAPYIVVPLSARKTDHLLLDLGHVDLDNVISLQEYSLFDTIKVTLDDVKITRYSFLDTSAD